MKFRGITWRWARSTFVFTSVLLLVLTVLFSLAVRAYYYSSVRNLLDSRDNSMTLTFFTLYSGNTDESFSETARQFLESFDEKDKMSLWVIDRNGKVIATSDGFEVPESESMQDYYDAKGASNGRGDWTGRLETGEKVMAMTMMLPDAGGKRGSAALRYIVSLENVDAQVFGVILIVIVIYLLAVFITALPSVMFINKVVRALKTITAVSKKIAAGSLETRVEPYPYDDELRDLQRAINNMVDEISAADKMKNDFISTVSHELRTPLTAIKGWGETLQQIGDSDPAMTKRGMDIIISESSRLTGMVEELLDFSRMQSGRMGLRLEKIDVLAELDETIFAFKERAMREGKELLYNVPNIPAPMNGDADRIKQVFVNIIDNAIKYTKQGGKILIEAQINNVSETKAELEINVSDTGCGISEKDLPRVKEKFYKADTTVRGSGIGLAVANEIMSLHGGELLINSVLGQGTTVTIKLPVEPVVLPDERGAQNEK
ncbi:MAG: HAMP domain-containing histidine kinase [Clostridiales bacterium]|nr:HAMP domain-containing histidine kinase [Clostridiales bacterium]